MNGNRGKPQCVCALVGMKRWFTQRDRWENSWSDILEQISGTLIQHTIGVPLGRREEIVHLESSVGRRSLQSQTLGMGRWQVWIWGFTSDCGWERSAIDLAESRGDGLTSGRRRQCRDQTVQDNCRAELREHLKFNTLQKLLGTDVLQCTCNTEPSLTGAALIHREKLNYGDYIQFLKRRPQ